MHRFLILSLCALAASGCHAKFKKHAPGIDEVQTRAYTMGGPWVNLGRTGGDDIISAVVDVVQFGRGLEQTNRIAGAVDPDRVAYALQQGLADSLGQGPPFAYSTNDNAPVVQLEVTNWGVEVPYIGAPGVFNYNVRVRIYEGQERVYSTSVSCATGVGAPTPASVALGGVDNVRQLNQMTDEQIQAAFENTAYWCGQTLTMKMRRHAS